MANFCSNSTSFRYSSGIICTKTGHSDDGLDCAKPDGQNDHFGTNSTKFPRTICTLMIALI